MECTLLLSNRSSIHTIHFHHSAHSPVPFTSRFCTLRRWREVVTEVVIELCYAQVVRCRGGEVEVGGVMRRLNEVVRIR